MPSKIVSPGPAYHNRQVVDRLSGCGVRFVNDLHDVPRGACVVFSAHGVAPSVREEAASRHLRVVDTTCPLVTKVHNEARRFAEKGFTIILIGHSGHDETLAFCLHAGRIAGVF